MRTAPASVVLFALIGAAAVLASAAPARADGYLVFQDDRAGFHASLDVNALSTVIDSGGAFAANPTAATGLASIVRNGTVNGQGFAWTGYDINFANVPTGTLAPGVVGGDIASATTVDVETPASQGTVTGAGFWGLDSGSGSTTTRNAFLIDFTATPGSLGIGHFGLDLIDFEAAAAFTRGTLRLYNAGTVVFSRDFDWGLANGNNQTHFLGVVALNGVGDFFDQALLVVGDDSAGGGNSETWAADRFTFGQAVHNPEPGTLVLFGSGVVLLVAWRRRRKGARSVTKGDSP